MHRNGNAFFFLSLILLTTYIHKLYSQLDMPSEHLIENFSDIMSSVNTLRPKRGGKFITRVLFTSPPSKEIFRIDPVDFPFEDYERPEDEKKVIVQKKSLKKRIEKPNIHFVRKYDLFKTPIQPSY